MPEADSETQMQTGHAVLLMTNPKGAAGKSDWIKFQTDSCGTLLAINNGRSMARKTSLNDGMNGFDDFEEDDPSDLGKDMIGQWLSEHSEIAVVGDGWTGRARTAAFSSRKTCRRTSTHRQGAVASARYGQAVRLNSQALRAHQ